VEEAVVRGRGSEAETDTTYRHRSASKQLASESMMLYIGRDDSFHSTLSGALFDPPDSAQF